MYRYEQREKRDKPVKIKKMKVEKPMSSNKRDKKNSVSAFKGKM